MKQAKAGLQQPPQLLYYAALHWPECQDPVLATHSSPLFGPLHYLASAHARGGALEGLLPMMALHLNWVLLDEL